jgi:hypothetical protein
MRKIYKSTIGLAAAGVLLVGLAACSTSTGTDSGSSTGTSSSTAAADPTPVASIPELAGISTQVTLDQGFLDALTSLGLTPGLIGPATLDGAVLSFPITGGNVDYYDPNESYRPYVQGEIDHDGSGITLSTADGSTVVGLSDFVIDPGTSRLTGTVTVNGTVAGTDIFIFNLDGTTLKPLATDADGNAVLEGTKVEVSADAAALLNKTFNAPGAVPDNFLVGIAKITVKAAS